MIVKTGRELILDDVYTKMSAGTWYVKIGTGTDIVMESDDDLINPIKTNDGTDLKILLSTSNCEKDVTNNAIKIELTIGNDTTVTNQTITEFGIFTNENKLFSRVIQEPVVIGPSASETLTYYLYL